MVSVPLFWQELAGWVLSGIVEGGWEGVVFSFMAIGVLCFLGHGLWARLCFLALPFSFVLGLSLPSLHVVHPVIFNIYTRSPGA